ncbi:hypothetical protein SLS55_007938 [Diplodia seriata]|uniref:DNA repair protein rhp42 n=1 Tax=Diplodia seriata TaxID=420778 RepID=A0ABR3C930_9PEZI
MPPFVPRKRSRSRSPASAPASAPKRAKKNVFDALDAPSGNTSSSADKAFLDALRSDSSDGDTDTDGFEDVDIASPKGKASRASCDNPAANDGEDEDDEMDWEDAMQAQTNTPVADTPQPKLAPWQRGPDDADDVLEVSLGGPVEGNDEIARRNALGIKGPSKKDRQLRIWTHCMHVQLLLWHNHIRNGWVGDKEVQKILVAQLPEGVKKEVQRWRKDSGLPPDPSLEPPPKAKARKGQVKGKGKSKERGDRHSERNQRDWGGTAERTEEGVPNLSQGDPLNRLLRYLAAYWKKRFRITAPGLRKKGYFPTAKSLAAEIKAWQATKEDPSDQKRKNKKKGNERINPEEYDIERFGERIRSRADFLEAARRCTGSRDVGAQLFTALIRGIGLEARMVASLQPIGFGFTKVEEVVMKKGQDSKTEASKHEEDPMSNSAAQADEASKSRTKKSNTKAQKPVRPTAEQSSARKLRTKPLLVDSDEDSDSSLSSARSDITDASIIDITPSKPIEGLSNKHYDTDLKYPFYWTEALSPISNTYIPASPLVISTVASTPDLLSAFEPRGAVAEKAKQVICYVVAYNADGTAKDVTVRYLKKHVWPGKTKSFRMPVEKIPIYNKYGKVKRYEEFDWFKRVMSNYTRDGRLRTEADKIEDEGDLIPVKLSAANKAEGNEPETLQGYKNSAEYVLERHLRREEAIRPAAKPVRTFIAGKGDKAKPEPVFLRKDVVACKTAESWHKEGRQIVAGAPPMKRVKTRAVTLIRKREIMEAERESGEKATQGLYAREQTEWIVPPPIQDGKIPHNAFGNIDVYVPTMVPQGAVHVPLRGTARVCKKLGIDFAEACTGFEFGRHIAVPILTGVVVAEENGEMVREAWRAEQQAKQEREEKKRVEAALKMWRKFMLGLRVIERVKEEYGEGKDGLDDVVNPFARKKREGEVGNTFERKFGDEFEEEAAAEGGPLKEGEEDHGPGGFFLPGQEDEGFDEGGFIRAADEHASAGGFVRDGEEDTVEGGGFIIEGDDRANLQASQDDRFSGGAQNVPFSLQSAHHQISKENDDNVEEHLQYYQEGDSASPPSKTRAPPRTRGSKRGRGRGRGKGTQSATVTTVRGRRKSSGTVNLGGVADDSDGIPTAPSEPDSPRSSAPDVGEQSEPDSDTKNMQTKDALEEVALFDAERLLPKYLVFPSSLVQTNRDKEELLAQKPCPDEDPKGLPSSM